MDEDLDAGGDTILSIYFELSPPGAK